jgi:hypothetical protein
VRLPISPSRLARIAFQYGSLKYCIAVPHGAIGARTYRKTKGRQLALPPFHFSPRDCASEDSVHFPFARYELSLLQVDHLAAGVQRAVHFYALAIEFLHFILVVDVIRVAAGFVLQHILVAGLHHCTAEALRACRLRR